MATGIGGLDLTPPPRLHVLTATQSDNAVILRRGPSAQVAALSWDRRRNKVELGRWINGRIHEYRCDLSPDGKHLVYFACHGSRCWTAVSRTPWLAAIAFWPQADSWFGGGAFTDEGALWRNGAAAEDHLPDGLVPAPIDAYPQSTDGFHMGDLAASRLERRGWNRIEGARYETVLQLELSSGFALRQSFSLGRKNRAMISSSYALIAPGEENIADLNGWEWADFFENKIQWAEKGAIWQAKISREAGLVERHLVYDLTPMRFEAIKAPYTGVEQ